MRLIMRVIERWHWHLRQRFTFVEVIVMLVAAALFLDWFIRGDV